ncbi:hypothetical protein RRG08_035146 [Elysia crispata]|uniref:Uncharacterized protein n=1 Tax=Elysia crispata TaxID=231223 RepID=A0AAE1E059_9GAST|nr:hypothetical protein RRG08_035146 [Elysia crispata]
MWDRSTRLSHRVASVFNMLVIKRDLNRGVLGRLALYNMVGLGYHFLFLPEILTGECLGVLPYTKWCGVFTISRFVKRSKSGLKF